MVNQKLPFFILLCLSILSFSNCSKENETITACQLESIISTDNDQTTSSYLYNSQGNLEQITYRDGANIVYFSYLSGKVDRVTTTFSNTTVDSCILDIYYYDDQDNISKVEHNITRNANCVDYEIYANTIYNYTADGNLEHAVLYPVENQSTIVYDSIVLFYDQQKNISKREAYLAGEVNYLTTFQYDDQVNPLQGYLTNGANNVTQEYGIIYTAQNEITFTFLYEYNDLGIPTKVTSSNSQSSSSINEFEYDLKCE